MNICNWIVCDCEGGDEKDLCSGGQKALFMMETQMILFLLYLS